MELTPLWSLSRTEQHSTLSMLFSFVAFIAIALRVCGNTPCHAQETNTPSPRFSTAAENRFETPQSTAAHWVKAVNKHNWQDEYNCYTGTQQAKFTYQLMVSTRELSDSQDLSVELLRTFQSYGFDSHLLDEFPSMRLDLSNLTDSNSKQSAIEEQAKKRQEQLTRWERDVQPLNVDWVGMIAALQPLLAQSYHQHRYDAHPSSSGIAHHLSYHRFDKPSSIEIDGNRANGLIVAIVRDPNIMVAEEADTAEPNGLKTLSAWIDQRIQKLPIGERRIRRSPEPISFVQQPEGWKINVAPFR